MAKYDGVTNHIGIGRPLLFARESQTTFHENQGGDYNQEGCNGSKRNLEQS
jgi:hypothetical protein